MDGSLHGCKPNNLCFIYQVPPNPFALVHVSRSKKSTWEHLQTQSRTRKEQQLDTHATTIAADNKQSRQLFSNFCYCIYCYKVMGDDFDFKCRCVKLNDYRLTAWLDCCPANAEQLSLLCRSISANKYLEQLEIRIQSYLTWYHFDGMKTSLSSSCLSALSIRQDRPSLSFFRQLTGIENVTTLSTFKWMCNVNDSTDCNVGIIPFRRLLLCFCNLEKLMIKGPPDLFSMEELGTAIAKYGHKLNLLYIHGASLTSEEVNELVSAGFFNNNLSGRTLKFIECRMSSPALELFCNAWPLHYNIQELYLCDNCIRPRGAKCLLKALLLRKTLHTLDISGNVHIGYEMLATFGRELPILRLTNLRMNGCVQTLHQTWSSLMGSQDYRAKKRAEMEKNTKAAFDLLEGARLSRQTLNVDIGRNGFHRTVLQKVNFYTGINYFTQQNLLEIQPALFPHILARIHERKISLPESLTFAFLQMDPNTILVH